ncbi:T-cell receptor beta chain V region YT35 [Sciurus carolinensis]|nr:T-cell receptor beta chain V region YT35 [Sciurus carolinensis]
MWSDLSREGGVRPMLKMLLLLLLLGPTGSGLGAHVSQHPSRAICKSGTSVKIECHSVGIQARTVFWYRQFPKESFVLMATSIQGSDVTWEKGFAQDKFPISHPNLNFASLMVTSTDSADSSFYFCVASDTVLAGSGLGAHVSQHPSRVICKSGTSVKIECHSVGIQATPVFWYRQLPKESFVLMATSNPGSDVIWEQDIAQDKFPISHPNLTFASLMVTGALSEDSGSYFCGASNTVLGGSQRPRQEDLQQPAPPTLRPRSPVGGAWAEKTTASLNETSGSTHVCVSTKRIWVWTIAGYSGVFPELENRGSISVNKVTN